MEVSQTKRRIFADFSIESLLRKDEKSKPKRQEWGIVQHPSFLTTPTTTVVPAYFGESYYSYSVSSSDYYAAINSSNVEVPKPASVTPVQLDEEEEFISVSDENNETDCDKPSRKSKENNEDSSDNTFSWLNCTRFKPPKLLRPRRKGTSRRHGRGPRIPFSTHQLAVLESTFVTSQYLSSDAINRLAENLNLTETRVKIWFQNRRARFRRENNSSSFSPHRDHPPPSSIGFAEKVAPETGIHFSSTASKQSFRHLINDLNLMAAGAVIHANLSKN